MNVKLRDELGDYSSVVCLKSIITGMEDALGDKATAIALIAAGRARGRTIAKELDLSIEQGLDEVTQKVAAMLGKDGTRLMLLKKIEEIEDGFRVYTQETVCSAGEEQGSERRCTFTLGAAQGVLEAITEQRFRGVHVESVLRGGEFDVFEYTLLVR
ncbi:MAG: hypothetical protein COB33_010250 [Thiotrichaceae bacterium]|nr:hypothetical protein [Thiotrichaceae bacterium]